MFCREVWRGVHPFGRDFAECLLSGCPRLESWPGQRPIRHTGRTFCDASSRSAGEVTAWTGVADDHDGQCQSQTQPCQRMPAAGGCQHQTQPAGREQGGSRRGTPWVAGASMRWVGSAVLEARRGLRFQAGGTDETRSVGTAGVGGCAGGCRAGDPVRGRTDPRGGATIGRGRCPAPG